MDHITLIPDAPVDGILHCDGDISSSQAPELG